MRKKGINLVGKARTLWKEPVTHMVKGRRAGRVTGKEKVLINVGQVC